MAKPSYILILLTLWLGLSALVHAGTVTYVYTDPQGTPLAEADANGNITATFDYAPYGKQALGTAPSGPGYTGHVNDPDTGLVYMQARYYDPVVGRFLSTDPIGPAAGNPFNFNRYAYASNNPIINMDPDGQDTVGENIDENAQAAADAGNNFATYGWALAGVAWSVFGAEPVSQVADKGTAAGPGNMVMAVVTVVTLGKGEEAATAAKEVEQGIEGVAKEASAASKAFSSEKQALVDMAKSDKRTGMTSGDMQAYKDLNKELPDPFPTNKVRGPEAHGSGAPTSQQPHGHVGPVDHIPIKDPPPPPEPQQ